MIFNIYRQIFNREIFPSKMDSKSLSLEKNVFDKCLSTLNEGPTVNFNFQPKKYFDQKLGQCFQLKILDNLIEKIKYPAELSFTTSFATQFSLNLHPDS